MTSLWISTSKFTCLVQVNKENKIVFAAPILKRFRGQKLDNLVKWTTKQIGPIEIQQIL